MYEKAKRITIYTDGSCLGNPGPGGYGAILLHKVNGSPFRKEISQGYRLTTNSRMELMAVIKALEVLNQPCRVEIFSDSRYVVDAISQGWAKRWRMERWMVNSSKPRPNADLWRKALRLCEMHSVGFEWLKGHSGIKENETCDQLANQAARSTDLLRDFGYEKATSVDMTGGGRDGHRQVSSIGLPQPQINKEIN